MQGQLLLATSPRLRFITGMVMYFAQGVPAGLLAIAMPAWMASEGLGAGDIATYLAVITLPWSLKLVTGPLMDRYQFPVMGRRRPWVLAAQIGLTCSLLALVLVDTPMEQIGLLMFIGIIINCFAATQDVAVDGMCIDLVPTSEQGRLNAFMSFGKAIGWASSSAASGIVLVTWGLEVAALAAASVSGFIALAFLFVREREGERLLPWCEGKAFEPMSMTHPRLISHKCFKCREIVGMPA